MPEFQTWKEAAISQGWAMVDRDPHPLEGQPVEPGLFNSNQERFWPDPEDWEGAARDVGIEPEEVAESDSATCQSCNSEWTLDRMQDGECDECRLAQENSSMDEEFSMSGPEEGDEIDQSVFIINADGDGLIEIHAGTVEERMTRGRALAAMLNMCQAEFKSPN